MYSNKSGGRRKNRRTLTRTRGLGVLVAMAVLATFAGPVSSAGASLSATGPINPDTFFPHYYEDATGTQLELCLDGPPNCLAGVADGISPPDGESFWFEANAAIAGAGFNADIILALEAAYLGAGAGEEISFGRMQVGMDGLEPNSDYTITHPYGSGTWTTDADGKIAGGFRALQREEIGCAATPCDFDVALGTSIGPFLKWDSTAPAPPAGFIGDAATPHTVVGSPTGFNKFRIEGPGLPVGGVETDEFVVQGKLAGPPPAPRPFTSLSPGSLKFASRSVGSASAAQRVTVSNIGTAPMTINGLSIAGLDAGDFGIAGTTCAPNTVLAPQGSCTADVTFTATAPGDRSAALAVDDDSANGLSSVALSGAGVGNPVPGATVTLPGTTVTLPGSTVLGAPVFDASRLRASVALRRSYRLRSVRRNGVLVRYRAPAGADKVSFALYRVGNAAARKLVLRKSVRVRGNGLKSLRLRSRRLTTGRYRLQVRPSAGGRKGRLSTRTFRIVR